MNNALQEKLFHYKNCTLNLIEALEKEKYDELEVLLNERQELIEDMDKLHYSGEDFKVICKDIDLLPLQQKLTVMMRRNMDIVREKINKFHASKDASMSYNKRFDVDSLFLNKKI